MISETTDVTTTEAEAAAAVAAVEAEASGEALAHERCTRQLAQTADRSARSLSSQWKAGQCTAKTAT